MRDETGVLFFDIAGKTGVEVATVEGAYGLGRNALNQGIRPGPPLRFMNNVRLFARICG